MKIAIVHPHPVPLAVGGAENLWWGVQRHIAERTEHSCDLVTMGSPEGDFWGLVEAYRSFAQKDLSAYDLVISGKYPAWMVNHPNHVVFLQHRLRGLYDTYPLTPLQERQIALDPRAQETMAWMEAARRGPLGPAHATELLAHLEALRALGLSAETTAFPGPFSKAVVHFLDDCALNERSIRRFLTQSRLVRDRLEYFPPRVDVSVVYPPAHRDDYFCAGDDYLFTSSRLDPIKRIDQIILAMREVDADVPLLIAGTGPDEGRLRDLAAGDPRIRFLGFVDDDAMPGLLANALAVPFVPWMEDYGLVAVEAMKSSKPVLTFIDSGGPAELVRDGRTGYVTAPEPRALAQRIEELCRDRALARDMGRAGFHHAESINWDEFISELVGDHRPARRQPPPRKKITVATTFPIWPPRGGGQARVFHLYRNLARHFDVDVVSFAAPYQPDFEAEIAPGLREIRIAKSPMHEWGERAYAAAVGEIALSDVGTPSLAALTSRYGDALRASAVDSFAMVACHPYLVDEIRQAAPNRPLWYEAQDVEATLKEVSLKDRGRWGTQLLDDVRRVERACWRGAELVFACADRDLDLLGSLYGPTRAQLEEVPNGVALDETTFVDFTERQQRRRAVGLERFPNALFMGSWHGPNIEAVRHIFDYARELPEVSFLVLGSAGLAVLNDQFPSNVKLLGEVDVATRQALLATADVALNPTFSGSGTNVKMLDYFGAGIPVVTTAFGTRGLEVVAGVHATVTDGDDFASGISAALAMSDERKTAMVRAARKLVEDRYSWEAIAEDMYRALIARGLVQLP